MTRQTDTHITDLPTDPDSAPCGDPADHRPHWNGEGLCYGQGAQNLDGSLSAAPRHTCYGPILCGTPRAVAQADCPGCAYGPVCQFSTCYAQATEHPLPDGTTGHHCPDHTITVTARVQARLDRRA